MKHIKEKIKRAEELRIQLSSAESIASDFESGATVSMSVYGVTLYATKKDWPDFGAELERRKQDIQRRLEKESAALNAFEAILKLESDTKK